MARSKIEIIPLRSGVHLELLRLGVKKDQQKYASADLGEYLGKIKEKKEIESFGIFEDGRPVGYFAISHEKEPHSKYIEHRDSCVLLNFFIDKNFQGRGYGALALEELKRLPRDQFHGKAYLYLTVNCLNTKAKKLYLKSGFSDSGRLYYGGKAGPQNILFLALEWSGAVLIEQYSRA